MTIDEAIAKYKEIANADENCPAHCKISCNKCVQESKQLAEWLEDYKRIKMLIPIEQALKNEYNKAIDDLLGGMNQITYNCQDADELFEKICDFAEQLKAGGKNV